MPSRSMLASLYMSMLRTQSPGMKSWSFWQKTVFPAPLGPAMPTRMGFPWACFFNSWIARMVRKKPLSKLRSSSMWQIELRTAVGLRLVHHRELVLHQAIFLLDVVLEGARKPPEKSAVGTIASASGVEGLGVACPPLACPGGVPLDIPRERRKPRAREDERGASEGKGRAGGAETPRPLPRARDANASDG